VFRLRFRRLSACQPPGTAAPRLGRRYVRPVRGYGSSDATAGSRPPIAAITPPRGGRCQWPELSSRLRELRFKFIAESWPPAKSRKIWPESKSDPKSYKAAAGLPENMTGRHSIRIPSKGGTFPKVLRRRGDTTKPQCHIRYSKFNIVLSEIIIALACKMYHDTY
jgi:hypothetical protein